ncbi:hypothetical protein [Schlesneria paludicola]|uniref:hypothetical protein n=1 Tax=Schlesneria paludicola TaxID=360056 RepID=UPI00029B0B9A|nr:hypothetical protein [Schlesneria paludicola]
MMKLSMGLRIAFTFGVMAAVFAIPAFAETPTLVVTLKSIDEILDDADFIGESFGQSGLKTLAEQNLEGVTGGAGLAGIDRTRGLGFYWSMNGDNAADLANLVGFLPISDQDEFEALVRKFVPDLKAEDDQWSIDLNGQPLFAKFANDYCYISTSADTLDELAEPDEITNEDYDIAIEVNLASIPVEAKSQYLDIVEQGARKSQEDDPEPKNEAEARGRELGLEWMLAVVKSITNDGNLLTFGLDVNRETGMGSVDLELTSTPKTELAAALLAYQKLKPAFAQAVSDDAPLRLVISHPTTGLLGKLNELFSAMRKTAEAEIEKDERLKDDADKKAARDIATRLFNIAEATLKSGALHSVLGVEEGDDHTARIVAGTRVAKGDDAGKLLDDIMKFSKESPELAKVKPDVAKHAGARIHAIEPDANDKQTALFGTDPAHLAIRADSLWVAIGGGNLDALKKALDLSGKKPAATEVPISLHVKPAALVLVMERDDQKLIERAKSIAGTPGDVLKFELSPNEDLGIKAALEFGIDLFKLAGDN